jgi:hypothetical protein
MYTAAFTKIHIPFNPTKARPKETTVGDSEGKPEGNDKLSKNER